jgi:hypothetical protein
MELEKRLRRPDTEEVHKLTTALSSRPTYRRDERTPLTPRLLGLDLRGAQPSRRT